MDEVGGYDGLVASRPTGIGSIGLSEGYGGCGHRVGNTKQELDAIFSKRWAEDCFDEAIVCS